MRIAVLPDLHGKAWSGMDSPTDLEPAKLVDLTTFTSPFDTDAMALGYMVPGDEHFPRLGKKALPSLMNAGQEPLLVWALLDLDNEGHAQWESREAAGEALEDVLSSLPEHLVDSAGGYTTRAGLRLMWRLSPALPVSQARGFLFNLGLEVSDAVGIDVDPGSYEWHRLMRVPRATRDGQLLDPVIDLSPIVEGATLDPRALGYAPIAEDPRPAPQDHGDVPPEPVELDWEDRKRASDMPWALLGKAVPPNSDGSRYQMAKTALARIAQRGDYTDPHTLASFLWASVEATEGSSLDIPALWKLACWVAEAQELAIAERGDGPLRAPEPVPLSREEWEELRPAFRGRASTTLGKLKDGQPLDRVKMHYETRTYEVLRTAAMRTTAPADLLYRAFYQTAYAQRCPLLPDLWDKCQELVEERDSMSGEEELVRAFTAVYPLTVAAAFKGGNLYQLDTTSTPYQYVLTNKDLIEYHLQRKTLPGLPFEVDYSGLPPRTILSRYGGEATQVIYVSGQRGCVYDARRQVMEEGVHQLAKVQAVYHEHIDTWLRLIGEDDPELFLDWLACVPLTQTQPLCAVYINGAPGIGKSLLARGIASLWEAEPVPYNVLMGAFNEAMKLCPLLVADEGIVVDKYTSGASETFRNVVANLTHNINGKNDKPQRMRAAMRVLICANDDNGIPFREALGQDGIDAIIQRVMYLKAGTAARDYLEAVGGRAGITDWAPEDGTPGKIAEHLTWLHQNRKVTARREGQRFLVEGKLTPWHKHFAVRQGIKPGVLQVIRRLIEKRRGGIVSADVPIIVDREEQAVWVNVGVVQKAWDDLSRSYKAKPHQIEDAVQQLASSQISSQKTINGKRKRCWPIPVTAFIDAAVADEEFFEEE